MKLNTEKITRKSQYWHNINSLATEAFPPGNTSSLVLLFPPIPYVPVADVG